MLSTDECEEWIGGWEVMFYTDEPHNYVVQLDPDGHATICWTEDDDYCEEFEICPQPEPWEVEWLMSDDDAEEDANDEMLHWFGAWRAFGGY